MLCPLARPLAVHCSQARTPPRDPPGNYSFCTTPQRGSLAHLHPRNEGGLRNSKHESTLSSQEYVHELRSGITEDKLLNCLESLRVSLTSNPV
ncbi:hypothetical protein NHX12_011798, partial [Muraenolepis orangiensis]